MIPQSYFLIGFPVYHSASPYIYNKFFASKGISASYSALAVRKEKLPVAVRHLRKDSQGFNVTSPHKRAIMAFLDSIDGTAARIGAVNTVLNRNGHLYGYNTDWIGVRKSLERHGVRSKLDKVVVIGAGGAARAVVHALASNAIEVVIASATGTSAVELAKSAEKWGVERARGVRAEDLLLKKHCLSTDLIVNASPVGGTESPGVLPLPVECLREGPIVLDLVYNPLKTRLLKEAERLGCRTIDGLWVLCYQAVENLKLWIATEPPVEELRKYGLEAVR